MTLPTGGAVMAEPMMGVKGNQRAERVTVATLGCKLNQYESEAILAQFRAAGYQVVADSEPADVCVVNTCSVTSKAEHKGFKMVRSLRRRNPEARVLAVGCAAERAPDEWASVPGVDAVLGNREKEHLLDFLPGEPIRGEARRHVGETQQATRLENAVRIEGLLDRTRAFLKVQDGCSQTCTYCIIPQLRGRGRSLEIERAVDQARHLIECGFAEIVLTGVALGTYGRDLGLTDGLPRLLSALAAIPGLQRLRAGSVEPWAVTDRLLRAMAESPVICPHLHIPVQSGDDGILRRMNRRYTRAQIERILETAFRLRDDWGFGADVLTGFPGEGPREFETTRRFLADSAFAYLHIFPFSSRPGTPAARLPDPVPEREKRWRVAELKTVDGQLRRRFRERHLGTHQRVLFEDRRRGALQAGHTANYLDVYVLPDQSLPGTLRDVLITSLHPNGVLGELAN